MFNLLEKSNEYQSSASWKRQQIIEECQKTMKYQMNLLTSEITDSKVLYAVFQILVEQTYYFQRLSLFELLDARSFVPLAKSYRYVDLETSLLIGEKIYRLADFFQITHLNDDWQLRLVECYRNTPIEAFINLENQHQHKKIANGCLDTYQFQLLSEHKPEAAIGLIEFGKDGQLHLKPHFNLQMISEELKQKIYECIRDFLYHQNNLIDETRVFSEINPEDFKVELINILSQSKYQISTKPLLDLCESNISNVECLMSCYQYLDSLIHETTEETQKYEISCLKKLMGCMSFMQHEIIEDAMDHLISHAMIINITTELIPEQYTYEIQTLGPNSLTYWFKTRGCFIEKQIISQDLTQPSETIDFAQAVLLQMGEFAILRNLKLEKEQSIYPQLILRIYEFSLNLANDLYYLSFKSNPSSFESIEILAENPNQTFLDGLKNIQQLLQEEIHRLKNVYAINKNPNKHRWSITGVTRDKLNLVPCYQESINDIASVIELLENPNRLNIDESFAKTYAIKTKLFECLNFPANLKYNFFYNRESRIQSREILKSILRSFNKVLPEEDSFALECTSPMAT